MPKRPFPHTSEYMLWSPIVKQSGPNSKYDQMKAVVEVRDALRSERNVEIELVINEKYQDCLAALRDHASRKTEELKSPVLRLFQLESRLERHVASMKKKATKSLPSSQQF